MALKDRLKQARFQKGLTQVELAALLGVSKGAVGNYESGASAAKEEIMYKILDVLEIEPNFLFQDDYVPTRTSNNTFSALETKIMEKYSEINEDGQEKVIIFVDDLIYSGRYKTEPKLPPLNPAIPKWDEFDVEEETERFRQELIEEKRAKAKSSASIERKQA